MLRINKNSIVLIDCWDTILKNQNNYDKLIFDLIYKEILTIESKISPIDFSEALLETEIRLRKKFNEKSQTMSSHERIVFICEFLTIKYGNSFINELELKIDFIMETNVPIVADGIFDFFDKIRKLGVPIVLVSNTGWFSSNVIIRILKKYNLLDYFDKTIFSDIEKIAKPSCKAFEAGYKSFNVVPNQVWHIGDNLINDFLGAKKCGLNTIIYNGFNKSRSLKWKNVINSYSGMNEYIDL